MNYAPLPLAVISVTGLISIFNPASAGLFPAYDARSAAMGGTGVASAQIASAPFYNPAMLAAQRSDENFSLLGGVGFSAQDNNNLLDDLDAFVAAYNNSDITAFNAAATSADGKKISLQGNGFVVLGFAGESISGAISHNGYASMDTGFTYDAGSLGANSSLDLAGVEVSETGVALAGTFAGISIGIRPKQMSITSYQHSVLARDNPDANAIYDALTNSGKTDHGSHTNLDAGVVLSLGETLRVGMVMQNAMSEDYQAAAGSTINFDPVTRAGIAWTGDMLTLAFDYDMTENDPLIQGGEKTQYMAAGLEIDLLDSVQLRAGYNKNMADSAAEPTLSAGVGINLLSVQFDLAALKNNESVSAFLQLGVRF